MRRVALVIAFLAASWPAHARRVALVIGNAAYTQGPLANPVNDAEAIGDTLRDLGFAKVIRVRNASKAQMEKALGEMATESQGAEMAVVFFAGHGTERDGRNYLIPVDAKLDRASDLDLQAIALPTVLDQIAGASKLKLVILDACRNNVFPLAGDRRSATCGLARVEPEDNTLVAYAAKAGTVAQDGVSRRHSPFTNALVQHLPTPTLDIRIVLGRVRDTVLASTQRGQEPFIYGSLGGERLLLGSDEASAPVAATVATSTVEKDFEHARNVGTKGVWDAFLRRHPNGYHSDLARESLGSLKAATEAGPLAAAPNKAAPVSASKEKASDKWSPTAPTTGRPVTGPQPAPLRSSKSVEATAQCREQCARSFNTVTTHGGGKLLASCIRDC